MKISDLKERITLLKRVITEDQSGDLIQKWTKGDTVWANITPIFSKKTQESEGWGESLVPSRYKVILRKCQQTFQRIQWKEDLYSVVIASQADENQRWLTCVVQKKEEEA